MARNIIEELVGKTITNIQRNDKGTVGYNSGEEIIFTMSDGSRYAMYHEQDCCESVYIDDIVGDLNDLLNSPLTLASEDYNSNNSKAEDDESFTWTFYNFATVKGYVTIKWYGSSNGYYSESAQISKIKENGSIER